MTKKKVLKINDYIDLMHDSSQIFYFQFIKRLPHVFLLIERPKSQEKIKVIHTQIRVIIRKWSRKLQFL